MPKKWPFFTAQYRIFVLALLLWPAWVLAASKPLVNITGANKLQQKNIEAWVGSPGEGCELPAIRERSLLRRTRQDVAQAMQALGYYHADIALKIQRKDACWALDIAVQAGEPVRISKVRVLVSGAAQQDPAFIQLLKNHPLQSGDILRHDHYEQLKTRLLELAKERGYFAGVMRQQTLEVDADSNSANIALKFDSGPRYTFGVVSFEQDILDADFLARFVRFKQGDAFDNRQLLNLRQSLSGSGYFGDARVQVGEPDATHLTIPVNVTVTALPRYVYTAGIGFATDTGPRLRLGLENRRANRYGHRYGTELELSPVRSGIGGNYDIPLGDPNRERINFSSSYVHEEVEDHLSQRYRLGAAHMLEHDSGWIASRSLEFEREYFTVAAQKDRTDLIIPGYELTKVVADDPVFPQRGWLLNGKVRLAHEALASSVSFLQVRGRSKWIFPVWRGRFLLRAEGGSTLADAVTELPASVRFFAGGDSSIRGYGYQSLGPENAVGEVIGGRHLIAGSIEYDIPFRDNWSVAAFTDGGNAFDKLDNFVPVYGVGSGIRWRSPIGPVRLDVARPSDGRDNFRLHISMGMDL